MLCNSKVFSTVLSVSNLLITYERLFYRITRRCFNILTKESVNDDKESSLSPLLELKEKNRFEKSRSCVKNHFKFSAMTGKFVCDMMRDVYDVAKEDVRNIRTNASIETTCDNNVPFVKINSELNVGTQNPSRATSRLLVCSGCGAQLQSKNMNSPGFVASEKLSALNPKRPHAMTCQRCYMLRNKLEGVQKFDSLAYEEILQVVKTKKALLILLVDLTAIPFSICDEWHKAFGPHNKVFIIGNKLDLLPKDSDDYRKHVRRCLIEACEDKGISMDKVAYVSLISAKSGFMVEDLVTKIFQYRKMTGSIFLLGAVNAGKSLLFNTLMHSDLCDIHALNSILPATVSVLPGTTMGMPKFPLIHNSRDRVRKRIRRLMNDKETAAASPHTDDEMLSGNVGVTELLSRDIIMPSCQYDFNSRHMEITESENYFTKENHFRTAVTKNNMKLNLSTAFYGSRWCYDTPGFSTDNHLWNLFTTKELNLLEVTSPLNPETVILRESNTLFIGGIIRIDVKKFIAKENKTAGFGFFHAMTVSTLPVIVCETSHADNWYEKNIRTGKLVLPTKTLTETFPPLEGTSFTIDGSGLKSVAADIVLSSLGWVAITVPYNATMQITVYSPQGKGVSIRKPLLRRLNAFKGDRIKSSPFYCGKNFYPHKTTPKISSH